MPILEMRKMKCEESNLFKFTQLVTDSEDPTDSRGDSLPVLYRIFLYGVCVYLISSCL